MDDAGCAGASKGADGPPQNGGASNDTRIAVVTSSWTDAPQTEIAVAVRSVAGALSRIAAVDVLVPDHRPPFGDGAFDVTPTGGAPFWNRSKPYLAVLVEEGVEEGQAATAVEASEPGAAVLSIGSVGAVASGHFVDGILDVGLRADGNGDVVAHGRATRSVYHVGLYARVHPGASDRRHYGLGSIDDYLLVLGDRAGVPTTPWPSEAARWLLARFPRDYVVVLEGGIARVWRSRSCVVAFEVHTRMDLWILMARARAVVDLLPGDVYARECVESARYGVPIVVPRQSAADGLASAGGGLRFSSTAELLSCVEAIADRATRDALASAGRDMADRWYGDPGGFVARLASALDVPSAKADSGGH